MKSNFQPQSRAAEWHAEVQKLIASGLSRQKAVSALAKARPALRESMVREANREGSRR
jgi:hypothetical protein